MLLTVLPKKSQGFYNSGTNNLNDDINDDNDTSTDDDISSDDETTTAFNLEEWVNSNLSDSFTNTRMFPLRRMPRINFATAHMIQQEN
ncbi:unnamed protein product [Onchocerca flexuosa]|uniref:Uncharacterized protein n=1 Tax=Onchocerca flexuosa TaxID=387005 RepID=A0A183H8V6_9BILA|nr:unnamed protein product [Onchocerca flexuosa]